MRASRLSAALFASALVGCTDGNDPPLPPPAMETEITLHLTPASAGAAGELHVAFVAYQEGADGEWKLLPGEGGVRKVTVTSERFGLAVACVDKPFAPDASSSAVSVTYSTVAEGKEIRDESCFLRGLDTYVARPIVVSGLGANESVRFDVGPAREDVIANGASELHAPRGTFGAMALVYASQPPGPDAVTPIRILRLPDIDFAASSPLAIDVSGGEAVVSVPIVVPAGLNVTSIRTMVRNGRDTMIARFRGTTTQYRSVPASLLRQGDAVHIEAAIDDGPNAGRSSIVYLSAPTPATIEAGPPLPPVAPTLPTTGKRLFSMVLPALTSPLRYVDTRFSLGTNVNGKFVSHAVSMSRGWRGDPALSYTFPDFSGVAGYLPALELQPAVAVSWDLARHDFNETDFIVGRKVLSSVRYGSIAP